MAKSEVPSILPSVLTEQPVDITDMPTLESPVEPQDSTPQETHRSASPLSDPMSDDNDPLPTVTHLDNMDESSRDGFPLSSTVGIKSQPTIVRTESKLRWKTANSNGNSNGTSTQGITTTASATFSLPPPPCPMVLNPLRTRKPNLLAELELEMKRRKVGDRIPMHRSKWQESLRDVWNLDPKRTKGELCRFTLFSDGKGFCSRQRYLDSLAIMAADIDARVPLTVNELAFNSEGYCLFLEVDFEDETQLPLESDVEAYVRHLQVVVKECFPASNNPPSNEQYDVYVFRNGAHVKEKEEKRFASMGMHIIMKHICLRSEQNFQLAALQDKRISNLLPIWSGCTDLRPYKEDMVNLRLAYSHKMVPCPTCALKDVVQGKVKKPRLDIYGHHVPQLHPSSTPLSTPLVMQSMSLCDKCIHGKMIDPNFYSLHSILHTDGRWEQIKPKQFTTLEVLRMATIMTTTPQQFTPFVPPNDLGGIINVRPEIGKLAHTSEERKVLQGTRKDTTKEGKYISPRKSPEMFLFCAKLVNQMIAKHNPHFAQTAIHHLKPKFQHTFKSLLQIIPMGVGSNYCLVRKEEHGSNCYYILTHKGVLRFHCHVPECKASLKHRAVEYYLLAEEKRLAHKYFGLGGETPVEGLAIPSREPKDINLKAKTQLSPEELEQRLKSLRGDC